MKSHLRLQWLKHDAPFGRRALGLTMLLMPAAAVAITKAAARMTMTTPAVAAAAADMAPK
jgi:hypothetical protein